LDSVSVWDDSVVGKMVKVTGVLLVEEKKAVGPEEDLPQQIVGTKRTLMKPRWELIK